VKIHDNWQNIFALVPQIDELIVEFNQLIDVTLLS
tara:strand:- start:1041 stop:1145 length:105 start_codon:yes stop_codon:yes gene_type:complete